MKPQRALVALTVINVVLLVTAVALQLLPVLAQNDATDRKSVV